MKKQKLTKKQKRTIKNLKKVRQIDSNKLRVIITEKKKWAIIERQRGFAQIQKIQVEINKLDGILLFINDLIEPINKEKTDGVR